MSTGSYNGAMRLSKEASFLLLLAIATHIPHAYEQYWLITYSGGAAVVWTILAALVTSGILIGAYQLAQTFVERPYAGFIAYLVTVVLQFGIAARFMRVYQKSLPNPDIVVCEKHLGDLALQTNLNEVFDTTI